MLSKRLAAIAALVKKNSIVADIGSDHGLLPCFLLKTGISKKAYAVDNKKGPLKAAINNISEHNLKGKVIPILGDGLNNLEKDVNSIVIAGMGFMTIKDILETNIKQLNNIDQVIIQSNTDINLLRKWIIDKNYLIVREKIVYDNSKYYFIIDFDPQKTKDYHKDDWLFSSILVNESNDLYFNYLKETLIKLMHINKFKEDKEILAEIEKIQSIIKRK